MLWAESVCDGHSCTVVRLESLATAQLFVQTGGIFLFGAAGGARSGWKLAADLARGLRMSGGSAATKVELLGTHFSCMYRGTSSKRNGFGEHEASFRLCDAFLVTNVPPTVFPALLQKPEGATDRFLANCSFQRVFGPQIVVWVSRL